MESPAPPDFRWVADFKRTPFLVGFSTAKNALRVDLPARLYTKKPQRACEPQYRTCRVPDPFPPLNRYGEKGNSLTPLCATLIKVKIAFLWTLVSPGDRKKDSVFKWIRMHLGAPRSFFFGMGGRLLAVPSLLACQAWKRKAVQMVLLQPC